ncbi:NAD(P)H-dependent flavin oxidoreductase [Staphylococcus ratti]|uniref:Probable nitronate monooxygenase n=1 Tax=Staphylococcus ratti TaxID=2892440 RepID=A0ABY3PBJ7_9STAP|nr:DUF561 domain-containing protein [Staphylococcus ratti]UEX89633.1 nitronate monooxygenase [Staphylococcus ratti]
MWKSTLFTKQCGIRIPIVQAGMAGSTSPELVATVSEYGGLGTLGAGYDTPEQLKNHIKTVKQLTARPFAVNLFVPESVDYQEEDVQKMNAHLKPYLDHLDLNASYPESHTAAQFESLIDIVIDLEVPICSFTFGIPPAHTIKKLKKQGIIIIGSATSVNEAIENERAGVDSIVAQGGEAGGHRGTFNNTASPVNIGTMALIPQVVDHVSIPVIAAGGIMDGRGVSAAFMLGASGVQMGTAFLTTDEAGSKPVHREALMKHVETETTMTRLYSGKWARGIHTRLIDELRAQHVEPLPYPIQNDLTKNLRKVAAERGYEAWTHLWSGQGLRLSRKMSTQALLASLECETEETLGKFQ